MFNFYFLEVFVDLKSSKTTEKIIEELETEFQSEDPGIFSYYLNIFIVDPLILFIYLFFKEEFVNNLELIYPYIYLRREDKFKEIDRGSFLPILRLISKIVKFYKKKSFVSFTSLFFLFH